MSPEGMVYKFCAVRQAPIICVMAPPIHLGAWSMALMLWPPFELHIMYIMIESLILQCHILFHSHCSVCKPLRQISVCHCRPLYHSVPVGPSPPPPATDHRPISVSFPPAWHISLSNSLTTSQLRLELS